MSQSDLNNYYPTEELTLHHLTFNKLRELRHKFPQNEYGELVICCDSGSYWRKEFFPFYKSKRKELKDNDKEFWDMVATQKNVIENILKEVFPYRVLKIERTEADDIIAGLVKRFPDTKHMIVSSDGDHIQLQKYSNVQQYCPRKDKFLKPEMPIEQFILEHILEGDNTDGICNVRMPDNAILDKIRQKPITKKFKEEVCNAVSVSDVLTEEEMGYFKRNQTLIDYDYIPVDILKTIVEEYRKCEIKGDRTKILNYFIQCNFRLLFDSVGDY